MIIVQNTNDMHTQISYVKISLVPLIKLYALSFKQLAELIILSFIRHMHFSARIRICPISPNARKLDQNMKKQKFVQYFSQGMPKYL